jgi:hypothetical protein
MTDTQTLTVTRDMDGMTVQDLVTLMEKSGATLVSHDRRGLQSRAAELSAQWQDIDPKRRGERAAIKEQILALWTEPNDLSESRRWPQELHKGRGRYDDFTNPMNIDHTRTWKQNGRLVCATTEPYQASIDCLQKLVSYLEQNGLEGYLHFGVETHNPGSCLGFVFVRKGDSVKIPTLHKAIAARTR